MVDRCGGPHLAWRLVTAMLVLCSGACGSDTIIGHPQADRDAALAIQDAGLADASGDGSLGDGHAPGHCTTAAQCAKAASPCEVASCPADGKCAIVKAVNGAACDDGNPCTGADQCQAGACLPGAVTGCDDGNVCTVDTCDVAAGCAHVPTLLACSDGNACSDGDQCQGGACAAGSAHPCSDSNPCTADGCDGKTGCVFTATTAPCDDGSACTAGDLCAAGVCLPGSATSCDDENPCTADGCVASSGCVHTATVAACNDANPCTTGDHCQGGTCLAGKALVCSDGNPCTDDSCAPAGGCNAIDNTAPCSDGNSCTLGDGCQGGACLPGQAQDCDDNNPCTLDGCSPSQGCQHLPGTAPCDDGDACTLADVCASGACTSGKPMICQDGNPCTDDACNVATGCAFTASQKSCDDGSACTVGDKCGGGTCSPGSPLACEDGNPCTFDGCEPAKGCTHAATTMPCDDGSACTAGDHCGGGACLPGNILKCNDGNGCTDDSCAPASGCIFAAGSAPCSDGNVCTIGDACQGGTCLPGAATACDDGNACTSDGCHALQGCISIANGLPCDDGDVCTLGDACAGSGCQSGKAIVCDDGNPCTADACDAKAGCIKSFNTAPCNDGNACSGVDACSQGTCAGKALTCNDGNACTEDVCDATKGCLGLANVATCTDGDACTLGDFCQGGTCLVTGVPDCDDGNGCTVDSCDAKLGCQHPIAIDGSACGPGVCSKGGCVVGTQAVPATSCKQALAVIGKPPSGVYWLDPDGSGPVVAFQAYCDMVADGGGWTLLLKTDGSKSTFAWDAAVWSTGTALNPGAFNMDTAEARLASYGTVPFSALRIGMQVGAAAPKFINVPIAGSSLAYLMMDGKYSATTVGRAAWKSLLVDGSLQTLCNQEGFNTKRCRIGITANQEDDCNSPDSWLGIGCTAPTSGNYANPDWSPDNGGKATQAFGFVLAR